jgi:hypothetical protein
LGVKYEAQQQTIGNWLKIETLVIPTRKKPPSTKPSQEVKQHMPLKTMPKEVLVCLKGNNQFGMKYQASK